MVEAYRYAEGTRDDTPPPKPLELAALQYIDRFGVTAVYGRAELSAGEMRRMVAAENVVNAYLSRRDAMENGDVAEWAKKNHNYVKILTMVERIINAD